MLNEPTTEKLIALRLHGMRAAWEEQHTQAQSNELGFDERFGLLVEAEHLYRDNVRLTRLLREAKLKLSQACVEDIEYSARRELDRAVVRQLATCRWVREHHNVLISGPTGAGKSYVACALAQQAGCATNSSWRTPTAPTPDCSPASNASTSWSSTTGEPAPPRSRSATTCSKSSTIDTGPAPPSSPANCPSTNGTPRSAIPPSPTPSSTDSFTTPTASC
jgi:hypothetical protein